MFIVSEPFNGVFDTNFANGVALETAFTLDASSWLNYHQTPQDLLYQFYYEDFRKDMVALGPMSLDEKLITLMPVTNKL